MPRLTPEQQEASRLKRKAYLKEYCAKNYQHPEVKAKQKARAKMVYNSLTPGDRHAIYLKYKGRYNYHKPITPEQKIAKLQNKINKLNDNIAILREEIHKTQNQPL